MLRELALRSLRHYWRPQLAVLLAVAVATAALTGALMVGDSMRASLRDQALDRLGRFTNVILAPRNVQQSFVDRLAESKVLKSDLTEPCPVLLSACGVSEPGSRRRVDQAQVVGVTESFWINGARKDRDVFPMHIGQGRAIITDALAQELGVGVGDDIILRIGKPSDVSTDSILGRRDERIASARLTIRELIPPVGIATFSLNLQHAPPKNIFVALETLQEIMSLEDRVNAVLVAPPKARPIRAGTGLDGIPADVLRFEDAGLRLRIDENHRYLSLESESFLLPNAIADIAQKLAEDDDLQASPLIAYLANEMVNVTERDAADEQQSEADSLPYSTIVALGADQSPFVDFTFGSSNDAPSLGENEIVLNTFAADRLAAEVGDRIRVSYYLTDDAGELDEVAATFTVSGIAGLTGPAADSGYVPEYPGITDAKSLMDWDPPFPIDFRKIRDDDEAYWDDYRATPKAFVSLSDGERLFATEADTLGTYTSIRFYPPADANLAIVADKLRDALNRALTAKDLGVEFRDLRAEFREGAKGSTDFSGLFIGFSFFLIASAAGLILLLFRLGIERRANEVGLLTALGYTRKHIRKLLLSEGAIIAGAGALLGVIGAIFYAWLMLEGLRNWWSDAVNAPFLRLSISPTTLLIGLVSGILLALATIWWSLRDLAKHSPRALLSGNMGPKTASDRLRKQSLDWIALVLAIAGAALILISFLKPDFGGAGVFFGASVLLLIAGLRQFAISLKTRPSEAGSNRSLSMLIRRSLARNPGRSMLTASLIASATFLLVSLEAFRLSPPNAADKESGTGGCSLLAESAAPIYRDLNSATGRGELNITDSADANFADVRTLPFRLRPGDETSCLNLYAPRTPRVVGAPQDVIRRGGFRFQSSNAQSDEEKENPWLLLNVTYEDGTIPAIGDEAAVKWQMHSGLNKTYEITDDAGNPRQVRFVALLSGSVLQSEIVIAEANFKKLFPSRDGYRFFLFATGDNDPQAVSDKLEGSLADYGLDAQSTTEKLRALFAVQNTYLTTFQTLGGFGLLLGTLGLAAVMLRNVYERRRELALLQAVGFDRGAIRKLVLGENAALVLAGLLLGALPAIVAVAPALWQRPGSPQFLSAALTLVAVGVVGMLAGFVALRSVWRDSLVRALRSE